MHSMFNPLNAYYSVVMKLRTIYWIETITLVGLQLDLVFKEVVGSNREHHAWKGDDIEHPLNHIPSPHQYLYS